MAPARLAAGKISVMIDNVRASIAAPPIPWRALAVMSDEGVGETAQAIEPNVKIPIPAKNTRLRP